ncbi:hypothetical protein B0H16DRAFT_1714996 [Mycena metata]|uniref:Uncharacterized protein n=1 Tax=Mycena metata TaxID=1033252 RepID=A0AAD7JTZ6_9AGAR|nr:hypothetical protein B0H16DRAFT_1714996 [Mycena metata]
MSETLQNLIARMRTNVATLSLPATSIAPRPSTDVPSASSTSRTSSKRERVENKTEDGATAQGVTREWVDDEDALAEPRKKRLRRESPRAEFESDDEDMPLVFYRATLKRANTTRRVESDSEDDGELQYALLQSFGVTEEEEEDVNVFLNGSRLEIIDDEADVENADDEASETEDRPNKRAGRARTKRVVRSQVKNSAPVLEQSTPDPQRISKNKSNAKRRERRSLKPKPALSVSLVDQATIRDGLIKSCSALFEEQRAIAAAITAAGATPNARLNAVDQLLRNYQQLCPLPLPEIEPNLAECLAAYAADPLHWNVETWVARGVLVEDKGQLVANNTARSYVRIAHIPGNLATSYLEDKMYARPSEIPWLALVLVAHGVSVAKVSATVKAALDHYGLQSVSDAVADSILQLSTPFPCAADDHVSDTLLLTNGGITIASTPYGRLQDELKAQSHSRFHHLAGKFQWKAYHIPAADTHAPGGHLDFRTNPAIGRWEALVVNANRGLGLNTTPGGNWIPTWQPRAVISAVVASARLPWQPTSPSGLSPELAKRLKRLLKGEHDYWTMEVGKAKVCVPATLVSITKNLVDATWTVAGTTVVVTVAEDLTEEERKGKVGGIEEETAGPAMKEFQHAMRLLHPDQANLATPSELRQIRGSFLDLYRLQEPVARGPHLPFFMRLLGEVAPAMIITWSNTMNRVFVREEVRHIVTDSDMAECRSFFAGTTHDPTPFIPRSWRSPGVVTTSDEYIDELGIPVVYHYSFDPSSLIIKISNIQPGFTKHDARFANIIREIFFLTYGGVVQPATAIIEADLLQNGPLDRSDGGAAALATRLHGLCNKIQMHAEATGVYAQLDILKAAYKTLSRSVRLVRSLPYRNKAATTQDDDQVSASCPGEGDSSSSSSSDADADDHAKKSRKPRRASSYHVLAATGPEARAAQLKLLVADAEMRLRLGRSPDPCSYAPFGMDITSPEFAVYLLGLDDGKSLSHAARAWGGSAEANEAQLANQAKIGPWNTAQAEARRVVGEDGLTPQMHAERTRRGADLVAYVRKTQDPRNVLQLGILEVVRWGTCGPCHKIVVGTSRNSRHFCPESGRTVNVTETEFPNLSRPIYIHDILNNPALVELLPDTVEVLFPDLLAHAVSALLPPATLQELLPADYSMYDPSACSTLVYLPTSLVEEEDLWRMLAVDVLLTEQSQCPPQCETTTATERNAIWKQRTSGPMMKWGEPRMRDEAGPALTYLKCGNGFTTAIERMSFANGKHWAKGEDDNKTVDGPQNCGVYNYKEIETLADLPSSFSRYFWLKYNLQRNGAWT